MNMTTLPPLASILIVDDDPAFRSGLAASLKTGGYTVNVCRNAEEAFHYVRERPVDLILLDVNMPEIGGLEACQRIRAIAPRSGILMLTVRDSEDDKVHALQAGADDYITKPFRLRELVARMGAVLRRTAADAVLRAPLLRAAQLELDLEHRTLRKAGQEIHLSPKEFELLAFLMQHKDLPVAHAKLLRAIWGSEYGDTTDSLRTCVRSVRRKIEDNPSRPAYILTEARVGYRFRDPSDHTPNAELDVASADYSASGGTPSIQ
jgi:two-component system KDP operon response regulator KdpE